MVIASLFTTTHPIHPLRSNPPQKFLLPYHPLSTCLLPSSTNLAPEDNHKPNLLSDLHTSHLHPSTPTALATWNNHAQVHNRAVSQRAVGDDDSDNETCSWEGNNDRALMAEIPGWNMQWADEKKGERCQQMEEENHNLLAEEWAALVSKLWGSAQGCLRGRSMGDVEGEEEEKEVEGDDVSSHLLSEDDESYPASPLADDYSVRGDALSFSSSSSSSSSSLDSDFDSNAGIIDMGTAGVVTYHRPSTAMRAIVVEGKAFGSGSGPGSSSGSCSASGAGDSGSGSTQTPPSTASRECECESDPHDTFAKIFQSIEGDGSEESFPSVRKGEKKKERNAEGNEKKVQEGLVRGFVRRVRSRVLRFRGRL